MYVLVGLAVVNIFAFVFMYVTGYFLGPLPKAIQRRAMDMYNTTKQRVSKELSAISEL